MVLLSACRVSVRGHILTYSVLSLPHCPHWQAPKERPRRKLVRGGNKKETPVRCARGVPFCLLSHLCFKSPVLYRTPPPPTHTDCVPSQAGCARDCLQRAVHVIACRRKRAVHVAFHVTSWHARCSMLAVVFLPDAQCGHCITHCYNIA